MEADFMVEDLAWEPAEDTDGPGKDGLIVVWENGEATQTTARWGLRPRDPSYMQPLSLLRAEGGRIGNRCLIIANDFVVSSGSGATKKRHRVTFNTAAPFFCFAGTWRAPMEDWPAAYAAITVDASPDLAPFKERQMAVVREEDWQAWLTGAMPVEALMEPHRMGSFYVENSGRKGAVRELFG